MFQSESQFKDNSLSVGYQFPNYMYFLLLVGFMILGNALGTVAILIYDHLTSLDITGLLSDNKSVDGVFERNHIRWVSAVGQIFTFLIPALLTVTAIYKKKWIHESRLQRLPSISNILLGSLFVLMAFPLVQVSYLINKSIPLPGSLENMENQANQLIESITVMNSPSELLLCLFVIAIIPAIGEEFIFRGIIQKKLQEILNPQWVAIWLTAILFSAFHLQFEGFLPRMILGACLGYLFYWTKNLWIPIIAHAVVNGSQIIGKYYYNQEIDDVTIENNLQSYIPIVVFTTLIFVGLGYILIKANARRDNNSSTTTA